MTFEQLGLRAELARAVANRGYTEPTPIQARAIPAILEGRDVLGGAQTGTGKTAAFSLPLLQRLAESTFSHKRPRCLVLTPTRELASQVHQSVVDYGKGLNMRSAVIFGGVGFNAQVSALRRGLDIIVATPGRLLDLCQQGEANLSGIEILVLDEADRMLDMGFIHDIRRIIKLLPDKRQNLMFSATYAPDVKKLADGILRNPVEVEVARRSAPAELVEQEAYSVGQKSKRDLLSSMILKGDWTQVLVFTRTKHGANRLATQLEKDGITSMAIHGNKSQSARERALHFFKKNEIRVLVATDIAARGLDIAGLPHVVNYELPNVPEDYVHRIGRTGRAGATGKAISLVGEAEDEYLWNIEKLLNRQIPLYHIDRDGQKQEMERSATPPRKSAAAPHRQQSQRAAGGAGGGGGRSRSGNRNRGGTNRPREARGPGDGKRAEGGRAAPTASAPANGAAAEAPKARKFSLLGRWGRRG